MVNLFKAHNITPTEEKNLLKKEGINVGGGSAQVAKDILQSGLNVGNRLREFAGSPIEKTKEAFNRLKEGSLAAGKQVREDPARAFHNVLGGAAEFGHGISSIPGNIADYFARQYKPELMGIGSLMKPKRSPYAHLLPELVHEPKPGDAELQQTLPIMFQVASAGLGIPGLAGASAFNALAQGGNPLEAAGEAALMAYAPSALWKGGKRLYQAGKELGGGAKYTAGETELANKFANMQEGNYNPSLAPIISTAEKHGVPLYPGDLFPKSGLLSNLTEVAEKTPVINIQAKRMAQNESAYKAATNLLEKESKVLEKTPFEGIKKIEEIAQGDTKRAPAAKRLLESINGAESDVNQIIKTSGDVSLFHKKLKADSLFDKVSELAEPFGKVSPDKSIVAINEAISKASGEPVPNSKVISDLGSIKNAISGERINPKTGMGEAPLDFNGMRSTLSSLNSMINDYYSGANSLIGESGVGYLQSVVEALKADMEKFAMSHSPELKKSYQEANKYYKDNITNYKDEKIAKAFNKNADPEQIYHTFIKKAQEGGPSGKGSAAKFYNALDEKGRAAVRAKFLENMIKDAYDAERQMFSPAKVATAIKQNKGVMQFFSPHEQVDFNNVGRLMRAIEKSGYLKEPQTGYALMKYILGGAAISTMGIPSYMLKKIMGSESLARLLAAKGKE